jgi:phosphopantetheinyl transferase
MPLVYQQNINAVTKIGVWHIAEPEDFFLRQVPLQREITHWHKRLQHLAGRLLLKELYPDFPVALIQVAGTKKPFLQDEPFHFSISHCGDYAAAMVSKEWRVGVDVELKTDKIGRIIPKFLRSEESFLLPRGAINEMATLFWSVKETVFKWHGKGGVDFKKDILIRSMAGEKEQGIIHCLFRDEVELPVHYLHFNDNYLTWVLTAG